MLDKHRTDEWWDETVQANLRMPRWYHRQLKNLAFHTDTSIQALIMDALERRVPPRRESITEGQ